MGVNNLPKVVTWQRNDRESNLRPLESQANALTITPLCHATNKSRMSLTGGQIELEDVFLRDVVEVFHQRSQSVAMCRYDHVPPFLLKPATK